MSIAEMATGGSVLKQAGTVTKGNTWGNDLDYADSGSAITCRAEERSMRKSTINDGDGEAREYRIYFSSDPSLNDGDRLKLTKMHNVTLSPPKLRRAM